MSSSASDTRTRILAATLDLLASGAGSRVRMSDIARAADLSRQALYLHFKTRVDLLVEATYFLDRQNDTDTLLAPSRSAPNGRARLDAFVAAWTAYIPRIQGVARAFLDLERTDPEARAAWAKRMEDMREGCEAAVMAVHADGDLAPGVQTTMAADLLFTLLSLPTWEHLTRTRGYSQDRYEHDILEAARRLILRPA